MIDFIAFFRKSLVVLIALTTLIGNENRVNAMSCVEVLNGQLQTPITKDHQISNLLKAGFKRLGNSEYFFRGGFLVQLQPDGSFNLHSSISSNLGSPEFSLAGVTIDKSKDHDELKLFFGTTKYGRNEYVYKSFGSGHGRGSARLSDIPSGSQRDMLIRNGAQVDPTTPSLIRISLYDTENGREKTKLKAQFIAVMEGGNIVQVVAPVDSRLNSHVGPGTEIVGFRLGSGQYDHGISTIRLRQKSLEYEINDDYKGGTYVYGSQSARLDLADVSNEELGINLAPATAQKTDEWIGGFNVSGWARTKPLSIFRNGPQANNLEVLKKTLKPGRSSEAGFLGQNESFEGVLQADDNHVRNELKLTHQAIGGALLKIMAGQAHGFPDEFTYMGYRYHWKQVGWMGSQYSPFNDGSSASYDVNLTNLDNGKTVSFSALVPVMIYKYGFYEGKETPYRVDPDDVVAVLPFLKDGKRHENAGAQESPLQKQELKRTLFDGIKLQAEGGRVQMKIEGADGSITNKTFASIEDIHKDAGETIGVQLVDKDKSNLDNFFRGVPILTEANGNWTIVFEDISKEYVSKEIKAAKRITISFENKISLVKFKLTGFHVKPSAEQVDSLTQFIRANYASKPLFINAYSDQFTLSAATTLRSISESSGLIALTLNGFGSATGQVIIHGQVEQVIPHENYTEVILAVQLAKGAYFTGPNLKIGFKIDVGHGVFGR